MRLSVASLRRMIKGNLHVEFVRQDLTSYSGLELLRRYLRQLDLPRRLRAACAGTGGDYGGGRLALLILALFYVGRGGWSSSAMSPAIRSWRASAGWRGSRRRGPSAIGCASSRRAPSRRWSSLTTPSWPTR